MKTNKKSTVNYINKSFRNTTKADIEYVELLNALYVLHKHNLPCTAVFNKLLKMTSKILDKEESL